MKIAGILVVETTGDQEMEGTEVQEITLEAQVVENTEGYDTAEQLQLAYYT